MKNIALLFLMLSVSFAQMNMGADIVSRNVWRGIDFGDAAAVQPFIEYSLKNFTVGTWGTFAINGAKDGNELDTYISASFGNFSITLTDYFVPVYVWDEKDSDTDWVPEYLNTDDHIYEISIGAELAGMSATIARNVLNDDLNSTYAELGYGPFAVGFGNGSYSEKGDDSFAPVTLSVSAERDMFFASYVINPDKELAYLVFGVSF